MGDRANKSKQRKKSIKTRASLPKLSGRTVKNESEFKCYQKIVDLAPPNTLVTYEGDKIPYTLEGNYLVDFTVETPKKYGGKKLMIEFKGAGRAWDAKVRQKMLAARDQNPDLDIKIVFYRDAPFGAARKDGTRQRQSDWAKRNGFDFCVGIENIPSEWFE